MKKLIVAAAFAVVLIAAVVILAPGIKTTPKAEAPAGASAAEPVSTEIPVPVIEENEKTDDAAIPSEAAPSQSAEAFLISTDLLRTDQVSFIRPVSGSRIELLARLGDDGKVKAALGTCQSCNGSPMAYYTQVGDLLRCNNCGQTFPLSVLDTPGGGCHPIMIDAAVLTETGDGLLVDTDLLGQYEPLFSRVAEH